MLKRVRLPKLLANHALYALRSVQTLRQKSLPSLASALPREVDVDDVVRQRYGKQKSTFLFIQIYQVNVSVKRNELGVQLLPRGLHRQIFKSVSLPSPPPSYVQISKEHL